MSPVDDILNDLRNKPGYAAKYLAAAKADSEEGYAIALKDINSDRAARLALSFCPEEVEHPGINPLDSCI
jgi:hypothetical protein